MTEIPYSEIPYTTNYDNRIVSINEQIMAPEVDYRFSKSRNNQLSFNGSHYVRPDDIIQIIEFISADRDGKPPVHPVVRKIIRGYDYIAFHKAFDG